MVSVGIKKRKVSKKTKKSWRKNVDNQDVEAFLDDKRFEERIGKPFSTRKDEELFTVDKNRDESLKNEDSLSKKQRRELLRNKEPRCFAILKPHTAVPDPISKRNRVRTKEERQSIFAKRKVLEKNVKRLKTKSVQKKKLKSTKEDINEDVWQVELNKVEPQLKSEWLENDTKRHTLANTGRKQKKLPASLHKKPSVLPAVDAPHPGTSYNPSYTDHQDLLAQVAADEMKIMKEEAHLNRVTNQMFRKVTPTEKQKDDLNEMSEGLPLKNKDEPEDDDEFDPNVVSINPPTTRENKKTLVQRRKQKEQEQEKLKRLKEKVEKKKVADIYHLKQLKNQISKKQKQEEILREKRLKMLAKKALEPKVLSRNKFEPLEQEFQLGEELSGNLRNAQPSGTLLKDRYKSLQQRNIVAPGTVVTKKNKAKVKKFIKPDHKINVK